MVPRKVCPFIQASFSRARARSQSWMPLIGRGSGANRTCITEQSVKGAHRE
jgi:hypothetical protein